MHRLSSGPGTWSIRSGTAQILSRMDVTVWSQPLTFDGTALGKKSAGRTGNPAWILELDPPKQARVGAPCSNKHYPQPSLPNCTKSGQLTRDKVREWTQEWAKALGKPDPGIGTERSLTKRSC